ncbi:MAG: hypothetical protein E7018_05045 [Alphaproteobacteria bacterium]|nr:hypothetical protein [Alphaproteobacteria bacterium]
MRKSNLKYLLSSISLIIMSFISDFSYAATDIIVNITDKANNITQKLGTFQEELTNMANKAIQSKTGKLGDMNKLKKLKEKAERAKELYEKAKEKYERAAKLVAQVKEEKAKVSQALADLKQKAAELEEEYKQERAKIQEAAAQAKEIKEGTQALLNSTKDKIANQVSPKKETKETLPTEDNSIQKIYEQNIAAENIEQRAQLVQTDISVLPNNNVSMPAALSINDIVNFEATSIPSEIEVSSPQTIIEQLSPVAKPIDRTSISKAQPIFTGRSLKPTTSSLRKTFEASIAIPEGENK